MFLFEKRANLEKRYKRFFYVIDGFQKRVSLVICRGMTAIGRLPTVCRDHGFALPGRAAQVIQDGLVAAEHLEDSTESGVSVTRTLFFEIFFTKISEKFKTIEFS